jgi:hypothetical protein
VQNINSPGEMSTTFDLKPVVPSPLRHEDSLLVLEIAEDIAVLGKSKVRAWFQHHRPTNQALKSQVASAEAPKQSQLANQLAKIKDKLDK